MADIVAGTKCKLVIVSSIEVRLNEPLTGVFGVEKYALVRTQMP